MGRKVSAWTIVLVITQYCFLRLRRLIFGLADRQEENISGRTVIITGANTGLGKRTAFEMAKRGASVVLACRNRALGQQALIEIQEQTGSQKLVLMELDLSDLESIRKFAASVQKRFSKIHILINNAGVFDVSGNLRYTKDGFEMHFGVNHLGHFWLTTLLLDNLKAPGAPSRVVTISSTGAVMEELDLEDLNFKKNSGRSSYGKLLGTIFGRPYGCSKYANNLFTYELAQRLKGTNVTTYALCPGVVNTDIFREQKYPRKLLTDALLLSVGLTPEQGVETILYCALSKLCSHESGKCYQFSRLYRYANDQINADVSRRLWEESENLVGIKTS